MTREEAIKQMEEFMVIDDWSLVYLPDLHDALELAIEALKEQRPHGEWISRRDKFGMHLYSVCSECNVAHNYTDFPNFCPNCGADMREGEKE